MSKQPLPRDHFKVRVIFHNSSVYLASADEPRRLEGGEWVADWITEAAYGDTIGFIDWAAVSAVVWRFYPGSAATSVPNGSYRPAEMMERISRWVEDHPQVTGVDIRAAVKGDTGTKVTAARLLRSEGFLSEERDGPRILFSSRVPFRATGDDTPSCTT